MNGATPVAATYCKRDRQQHQRRRLRVKRSAPQTGRLTQPYHFFGK